MFSLFFLCFVSPTLTAPRRSGKFQELVVVGQDPHTAECVLEHVASFSLLGEEVFDDRASLIRAAIVFLRSSSTPVLGLVNQLEYVLSKIESELPRSFSPPPPPPAAEQSGFSLSMTVAGRALSSGQVWETDTFGRVLIVGFRDPPSPAAILLREGGSGEEEFRTLYLGQDQLGKLATKIFDPAMLSKCIDFIGSRRELVARWPGVLELLQKRTKRTSGSGSASASEGSPVAPKKPKQQSAAESPPKETDSAGSSPKSRSFALSRSAPGGPTFTAGEVWETADGTRATLLGFFVESGAHHAILCSTGGARVTLSQLKRKVRDGAVFADALSYVHSHPEFQRQCPGLAEKMEETAETYVRQPEPGPKDVAKESESSTFVLAKKVRGALVRAGDVFSSDCGNVVVIGFAGPAADHHAVALSSEAGEIKFHRSFVEKKLRSRARDPELLSKAAEFFKSRGDLASQMPGVVETLGERVKEMPEAQAKELESEEDSEEEVESDVSTASGSTDLEFQAEVKDIVTRKTRTLRSGDVYTTSEFGNAVLLGIIRARRFPVLIIRRPGKGFTSHTHLPVYKLIRKVEDRKFLEEAMEYLRKNETLIRRYPGTLGQLQKRLAKSAGARAEEESEGDDESEIESGNDKEPAKSFALSKTVRLRRENSQKMVTLTCGEVFKTAEHGRVIVAGFRGGRLSVLARADDDDDEFVLSNKIAAQTLSSRVFDAQILADATVFLQSKSGSKVARQLPPSVLRTLQERRKAAEEKSSGGEEEEEEEDAESDEEADEERKVAPGKRQRPQSAPSSVSKKTPKKKEDVRTGAGATDEKTGLHMREMSCQQIAEWLGRRGLLEPRTVTPTARSLDAEGLTGAMLLRGYGLDGGPQYILKLLDRVGLRPAATIILVEELRDVYRASIKQ